MRSVYKSVSHSAMNILLLVVMVQSQTALAVSTPNTDSKTGSAFTQFLYLPFDGDWAYQMSALLDHHFPNYLSDNPGQLHRIAFWQGGSFYASNGEQYFDPAMRGYWSPEYEDYMWYDGHDGYDWKMNSGTPIRAAAEGQITYAGEWNYWLGNVIDIDHGNGYKTRYAHLSRIDKTSGTVAAGEQIGLSGGASTDPGHGNSTGPHLHFSVYHYLPEHGWVITDPFGWDEQHGSTDLLVVFNGEQSQNLWVGGSPQTFGGGLQHPISTVPTNTQPMGGSPYMSPPPSVDNAIFLADVTLPDGSVATPGEALYKVWRVLNSGTSTWGAGYQLVFTGGDQMGAPPAVDVPATAPGATADIAVDMTAPSTPAYYAGHWRFRNPQGVYFGDELSIAIQVGTQSPYVSLYFDPPSPSNADHVFIVGTAQGMGDLRAMRILIDGEIVSELGAPEVNADWSTAPYDPGPHTVIAQAARWDDPAWAHPEQATAVYELLPGPGPVNHCPYRPSLIAPPDYYVSPSGAPTLVAQENGDPDGDPITEYFFEIFDSHDTPNSGWITQNSWTPSGLGMYGYQWHVKVRDGGGKESRWSETRHFLIEDPGPIIYDFHWEWCREAWGGPEKICFCADTNAGTLRVQVNMATDGSENGEWRIINELGVPQYMCSSDDDRPPNWGQLEAESGTHLARLYARREGGWEAAATADIQIYLPPERRPNPPDTFEPAWQGYVGSQTVHFDWKDSLRTDDYHLVAGLNPDPSQDPLLDVHIEPGTSEHTFTFLDDYQTIYWRVTSTGPYGTNDYGSEFHIDVDPPSSAVNPLSSVIYDPAFPVSWSGSDARSGIRWYDVQFRDGERGEWVTWMEQTETTTALFRGEAGHTYYFRSRAMDEVGYWEDYPPGDGDTFTLVDPTAAPPTVWWNVDYALKRNLVILNNDWNTMSLHYPVRLHFDSSTTPTAEDLYNASQSVIKGDDFRLVYSNTIELDRQVSSFSPSEVDIWFPLAADLGGGQSSEGQYQLYYINPGAVDPPADENDIFLPVADENTMGLWHFQEGSGGTVHDTSGRGHDGTFYSAAWAPGFLGTAGALDGSSAYVDAGDSDDFNLSDDPMTLEAWIYLTGESGGQVISKWSSNGCTFFFRLLGARALHFSICGGGEVSSGEILEVNHWYHVAATYDGNSTLRIYVNNERVAQRTDAHDGLPSSVPLNIGRDGNGGHLPALIQHVRVSNTNRTDFSYGAIQASPSLEAGTPIIPPGAGGPNLVLKSLATYRHESGGFVVQAVVRNEGDATTTNGFYSDLYANHEPTGPGDLSGSIRFWIASPIAAGSTITLTTLLTDLGAISGQAASPSPLSETTVTLYSQADSEGVVPEPDDGDNISAGVDVCMATADGYEDDDSPPSATPISVGGTQNHNFDSAGDSDWLKFTAEVGITYTMRTASLGPAADTYLYLYDTDGSTLLAANDDYEGTLASHLEWTPPAAGTYYLLVRHWNPNVSGCGTSYSISLALAGIHVVYLPLVTKSHESGAETRLYITNRGANNISVLDTSTNAIVGSIPIGSWPQGIAVQLNGQKAYSADSSPSSVSVVSLVNSSVVKTIPVAEGPVIPALSRDGSRLYVASHQSNAVTIIDTATDLVVTTIPGVQWYPWGIAVSPDGTRVAVALYGSGSVAIYDTANFARVATASVGSTPEGVAYHPDGSKIYVANLSSDSVSVISTASYTVVGTIPVGDKPVQFGWNATGRYLYVANNGSASVSEIDVASGSVSRTFSVGAGPIDAQAVGQRLYVTNYDDDTVSVVDLDTGTTIQTISGFHGPHSIGSPQFLP